MLSTSQAQPGRTFSQPGAISFAQLCMMLQLATFFLVVPILFIAFVERMGGTGGREREGVRYLPRGRSSLKLPPIDRRTADRPCACKLRRPRICAARGVTWTLGSSPYMTSTNFWDCLTHSVCEIYTVCVPFLAPIPPFWVGVCHIWRPCCGIPSAVVFHSTCITSSEPDDAQ